MGYLLAFARSMQLTARKNQLTFEQMSIQNQQQNITNQLSQLEMMAANLKDDEGSLQALQFQKQMLTSLSNSLEIRLKFIQTQLSATAAEETNVETALSNTFEHSAPKYAGR